MRNYYCFGHLYDDVNKRLTANQKQGLNVSSCTFSSEIDLVQYLQEMTFISHFMQSDMMNTNH